MKSDGHQNFSGASVKVVSRAKCDILWELKELPRIRKQPKKSDGDEVK